MSSLSILSTSQTSILWFRSTYILKAMTKYCVWYYLGKVGFGSNDRNPSLLVRDDARMKMCGKALGVSWWMQSLRKSRGRNPLGLWLLRFCPWHFPRDSICHGTPLAFPHIVPEVWSVNNRANLVYIKLPNPFYSHEFVWKTYGTISSSGYINLQYKVIKKTLLRMS